jgi:hypothetical protein
MHAWMLENILKVLSLYIGRTRVKKDNVSPYILIG